MYRYNSDTLECPAVYCAVNTEPHCVCVHNIYELSQSQ